VAAPNPRDRINGGQEQPTKQDTPVNKNTAQYRLETNQEWYSRIMQMVQARRVRAGDKATLPGCYRDYLHPVPDNICDLCEVERDCKAIVNENLQG
jgi:hypothetical protein